MQQSSAIYLAEASATDGVPVELYRFTCNGVDYLYTSDARDITATTSEGQCVFHAETITRENIKQGGSGNNGETIIRANRDSAVARLFTGPPPETPLTVSVYRAHGEDFAKFDYILNATVSQVIFNGSECELHCTLDAFLQKEVPHGLHQHYCLWTLFDAHCGVDKAAYTITALLDQVTGSVNLHSATFANYEDGYFAGGLVYYGNSVRQVETHEGEVLTLKYPFAEIPCNYVDVVPGCDGLFATCHARYDNTANFSGAPYCPPTDPEKNPTGQGAYWIDDAVIQRDSNGRVDTMLTEGLLWRASTSM